MTSIPKSRARPPPAVWAAQLPDDGLTKSISRRGGSAGRQPRRSSSRPDWIMVKSGSRTV